MQRPSLMFESCRRAAERALEDRTGQLLKSWRNLEIPVISCVRSFKCSLERQPMKQQRNSYFHSN